MWAVHGTGRVTLASYRNLKGVFSGMWASSLMNTLITLPRGENNFCPAGKKYNADLGEDLSVISCKQTVCPSSCSWHLFDTNI